MSDAGPAALFRRCAELLQRGDPEAARMLPALERHPGFAPGWEQIGAALDAGGQHAASRMAFGRAASGYAAAAQHDPDDPLLPIARAQCLRRARRPAEAAAAFAAATERDPSHAEAWFGLGLARQDLGEAAAAIAAYATALSLRPDWHEAALNLGVARQEARDLEGALDAYAAAFRSRPESLARIAQALTTHPTGRLYLRLEDLRRELASRG